MESIVITLDIWTHTYVWNKFQKHFFSETDLEWQWELTINCHFLVAVYDRLWIEWQCESDRGTSNIQACFFRRFAVS